MNSRRNSLTSTTERDERTILRRRYTPNSSEFSVRRYRSALSESDRYWHDSPITKDFVGDLMSGSAAWRDAVRSVFFAGKTENDVRAVAVDKTNNTAKEAGALTYTILSVPLLDEHGNQMKDFKGKPATVGKIVWRGVAKDITVEDINRRGVKAAETPEQKRQRIILESLPADGSEIAWADVKGKISGNTSEKAASLKALLDARKARERAIGMSRFIRRIDPSRDNDLFHNGG